MDKKLLFAVTLSIATLFAFNYFNKKNQSDPRIQKTSISDEVCPGQAYSVPTKEDLSRPINLEVDFLDKKVTEKEEIRTFHTTLCDVSFSNHGGILTDISFKKHLGKYKTPLKTIQDKGFYEREQAAFLLALEEKTPFFYKLADVKKTDEIIDVVYRTEIEDWIIEKNYRLYDDSYKIDLDLRFKPKKENANKIRPRLFFPAPFIGEVDGDTQSGVVITLDGKSAEDVARQNISQAWVTPGIFGGQNKYFVHSLIKDSDGFVQRGFFKETSSKLYPVLEGGGILEQAEKRLSFYIGPKLVNDIENVDNRLEGLLSFGWLSWICKLMLKLLAYLYSFLGNYGLAIIVMAILLKLPFIPLTISGRKKMDEFQKYQPTINRIKMKYKNDLQQQQAEIIKFYKDHNISPMAPLAGCLPFLLQAPIIFSLYRVLGGYLDIYQAPFFGWITDLSSKDPYYILPVLMGLSMLIQQRMSPVTDGKQKVAMMFMPILLTAVFVNFPAGLVLYWMLNNILTIGEDFLRKKYF